VVARENRVKSLWKQDKKGLQIFMSGSVAAIEAVKGLDYDSLALDMQHSSLTEEDVFKCVLALGDSPATLMVRLPGFVPGLAMRLLDAGVEAVVAPQVDTREQAQAVVEGTKYPPLGNRSFGPYRAARGQSMVDYVKTANDQTITFIQIESKTAVENLDSIVSVPGVDAVFIGPADLSLSYGGDPVMNYEDPDARERHIRIIEGCHEHGVKVLMLAPTPQMFERAVEWGADLITVAFEAGFVAAGASEALQRARAAIG
jgi:4-hydroxy-2-oxoheptanedioate aldolase